MDNSTSNNTILLSTTDSISSIITSDLISSNTTKDSTSSLTETGFTTIDIAVPVINKIMGTNATDETTLSAIIESTVLLDESTVLLDESTAFLKGQFNTTFGFNGTDGNIDKNALLQWENYNLAKALTPVTIYLIILMIIGIFGNSLVIYVYKFRFKRSTSRIFILSLAIFDLLTCLFGMPYHILDMIYPLTFVWNGVCKGLSFALTFTILASIFVLNLIAIDRYRKICIPFKKQLSGKGTLIMCWVVVFVALIMAVPIIFIYGSVEVETRIPNVPGMECYISADLMDSVIPMIYDATNILIFVVTVFLLSVLYIKVGIVVWKRKQFHEIVRNASKHSTTSGTSTPETMVFQMHALNDEAKLGVQLKKSNSDNAVQLHNTKTPIYKQPSIDSSRMSPTIIKKEKNAQQKQMKRLMSELSTVSGDETNTTGKSASVSNKKQMRTLRITAMLFIITLIFIVSFLPYLTIQIMNGLNGNFWNDMSITELILVHLLMRTYFINNMINPIVYWFLDKKFKQEVRKFFREISKCKWSKTFKPGNRSLTS
ncbi:uncharacterized protein LOC143054924 [Mytilus galloprovincialis]|uniref:uncharacterized protein LOC143054924 n=1 Tax=Mytilus galloprovincialis TaxID=29158 RepID=UPI003F7BC76D